MTISQIATGAVALIVIAGIIARPFKLPEAIWAAGGAAGLVAFRVLSPAEAWSGIAKGTDVYLFLTGMMLLAEIARAEKLFDWLASVAARRARGSARKLFLLIYGVGIVVTVFLSNDATAVVLTPAVAATARAAKVERMLPYLLICAFVANAASFVLPISNPANLVIYAGHMPALLDWLPRYFAPSILAVLATYLLLRWTQRAALANAIATDVPALILSTAGRTAALGIVCAAILLLVASFLDWRLGLPTALAGAAAALIVHLQERKPPWQMLRNISWSVLVLVAGLFVLVEALDRAGMIAMLDSWLGAEAQKSTSWAAIAVGVAVAFGSNLVNNLPAGLIASSAAQAAHAPDQVTRAVLIGIDLGPNLSVTGSLATILWLIALRREGQAIGAWAFLKLGLLIMPPALIAALAAIFL